MHRCTHEVSTSTAVRCHLAPKARDRNTPPLKALAMLMALLDSTKLRIFIGTSQQTTLSVVKHTWSRILITFRLMVSPPVVAATRR